MNAPSGRSSGLQSVTPLYKKQNLINRAKNQVTKERLVKNPNTDIIVQFSPFNWKKKKLRPESPGNEEYREYERMIDEMFAKTQNEVDNVKVCIATKNEKPIDDVHDYLADLSPTYPLNLKREKAVEQEVQELTSKLWEKLEIKIKQNQ